MKFKLKVIHTDALESIQEESENNPGTALERYKDFVKKNFILHCGITHYIWWCDYFYSVGNEKLNIESRQYNTKSRQYC